MACFAKLFHKNNGFNPTTPQSPNLPKIQDTFKKTDTGRYIPKPEGTIKFLNPDDDPIPKQEPEQNHQKVTLNNNYTPSLQQQNNISKNYNTNTNIIINNKQNTITNPSGTSINNNNSNNNNNIIQKQQQQNQIITTTTATKTNLNSNNKNNFEEEKPQKNIIQKMDTKINNNKIISTEEGTTTTTTNILSSFTNTTNTNNNEKNPKEIDNNEIVTKSFTNSKQQSKSTNTNNITTTATTTTTNTTKNNKNITINSIPSNKENISHPNKDIMMKSTNKEKLILLNPPSSSTTKSMDLNSNTISTTNIISPVENSYISSVPDAVTGNSGYGGGDVNPKIKELKKDKQRRPVITTIQPHSLSSSSTLLLNPYDKTGNSIEKLQKKLLMKTITTTTAKTSTKTNEIIVSSGQTESMKNRILDNNSIEDSSISVVNLQILGGHIIGNKDYEERRRNRVIQPQYALGTKIQAPLYLEELKKKQQEQNKQQQQPQQLDVELKCQRIDEKQNQLFNNVELNYNNSIYKNGYCNREYHQEQKEKNLISKNERCNPNGVKLGKDFSNISTECYVDSTTITITADIENKNFKNLSNDSSNDCHHIGINDDHDDDNNNDDASFKINNKNCFVDNIDDESSMEKINDLAKLTQNTINEIDNNKTEDKRYPSSVSILESEDSTARRKEGIFIIRPQITAGENVAVYKKDEKTSKLIMKAIENNDFLNNYMDEECKKRVIDAMEPEFYDKGKFIIRENEEGSEIYVSDDGVFDVIKNNDIINTLGSGIVFGELAILYNAKRFASIRAASKAKVWKIDRTKFRTIIKMYGRKEREENLAFLRTSPLLKDLREDILLKIVDLLVRRFFPTNTCIIRQNDVGDDFYIIRGGTVTVKKTNELGEEHKVNRLRRGDYFGEQALLYSDVRNASIYADAPGTECLKLDRVNFISYLGTIPELKQKPIDHDIVPEINPIALNSQYDYIELKDLKRITSLGAGAFGRVDLVTYQDNKSFALKVIKKIDIVKQGQTDHIYNEKLVMSMCHRSPFIVELYKTYRNAKYVYFLMEACLGGDVWTIMYQLKSFDEKTARFISGCVVEAFDFLHSRNIIFRDLKPENLMLTTEGYCKLVDFGFAKRLNKNYKTNTFAGTPEYVAPEIILDRGHDRAADYWTLGVLIYELLIGRTPFRGKNQMKIYQNILSGINVMPPKIPKSAQNLIKHLCRQLPVERLGYQRKGVMDIKKHSWYDGFDWNRLQNQTMSSPIKRPVNSIIDTQYFPAKFEIDSDVPPDELSGWDINF